MSKTARPMFGVGGLIIHPTDPQKFLLLKRSAAHSDFNPEKWELLFGRKNELESIEEALRREAREELGLIDLTVLYPQRLWHFFRGEATAENEIIGVTFVCTTQQQDIQLSAEHSAYEWVTAETALARVTVNGIRHDITIFAQGARRSCMHMSQLDGTLTHYAGA